MTLTIALIYLVICKGEIVVNVSNDEDRKVKPHKKKDDNGRNNNIRKTRRRS